MADPRPPTAPMPSAVSTAVKAMYVGAALSLIQAIVGLTQLGVVRDAARERAGATGLSASETATAVSTAAWVGTVVIVLFGLIPVAIWVWMARKNAQGRSWARTTGTVFFAFASLGVIGAMIRLLTGSVTVDSGLQILAWLAGLVAVIYMWRPESTAHYSAGPANRQPSTPPPWGAPATG